MVARERKERKVLCYRSVSTGCEAVPVVAGWKFEHSGMPAAPGRKFSGRSMGRIRAGFGAQSLDLSSILSGAPGRAERKVGWKEERRARGERRGGLTWNCQEAGGGQRVGGGGR